MNNRKAAKIRMMAAEGRSIMQIAATVNISEGEVEEYLTSQGIRPTYTVKQAEQEKQVYKYIPRVLGKPIKWW